jgi:hypothetical protein
MKNTKNIPDGGNAKLLKWCLICIIIVSCCTSGCKQSVKKAEQPNKELVSDKNTINKLKKNDIEKIDTMGIIQRNKDQGQYVIVSQELLGDKDLDYLSRRDLMLIRNEIFARYCYKFKDTTLLGHFKRQYNWYVPLLEDVSNFITPIENKNIALILSKEKANFKISEEQQFQIYLDSICKNDIRRYNLLLMYKFHPLIAGEQYEFSIPFPETNRYIYLLNSYYMGCNNCLTTYSIHQYSKKGQLLDDFFMGASYEKPIYTYKGSGWHEIMVVLHPMDDSDPSDENDDTEFVPPDTVRHVFSFDKNTEQIVFKERK